jgi:hypothetical protein
MTQAIDTCDTQRNHLIAAALGLQQCTKTAANLIPLPGTDRVIVIGTPAKVLEMLPAAAVEQPAGDLTDEQIIELHDSMFPAVLFERDRIMGNAVRFTRAAIAAHLALLPKAEQPNDLLEGVEQALALAMDICDAVPSRAQDLPEGEPMRHLGVLVNYRESTGRHGYALIRDTLAELRAHLASKSPAPVPTDKHKARLTFIRDYGTAELADAVRTGKISIQKAVAQTFASLSNVAQEAQHKAVLAGYVLMPTRLTAENGAKGALSGEFKESVQVTCPLCDGSGDDPDFDGDPTEHGGACLECNGEGTVAQNVPVSWDTIKDIYKAAVALLAAPTSTATASGSAQPIDWIYSVVRDVAELDRDSPEDAPDMMLVTADELFTIVRRHAPAISASAQASQAAASEWISVDERLPEPETDVLIIRLDQVRIGAIFIEHESWEEGGRAIHYWDDSNDDGQGWDWCEVTHWMPLPALRTNPATPASKLEGADRG